MPPGEVTGARDEEQHGSRHQDELGDGEPARMLKAGKSSLLSPAAVRIGLNHRTTLIAMSESEVDVVLSEDIS